MKRALLLLVMPIACATAPEPVKEPPLPAPDALELFRRARFAELSRLATKDMADLAAELRSPGVSEGEDLADWAARTAYRHGDGRGAQVALRSLPATNQTRRLLEAMFAHVDVGLPLRAGTASGLLSLPLDPRALDRGYPVLEGQVGHRPLSFLWDTGASENVLAPAVADALGMATTKVEYATRRKDAGFVVRFEAGGSAALELGRWRMSNVPWIVTELEALDPARGPVARAFDGVLSPQLLLPRGCFRIERSRAILTVGFEPEACRALLSRAQVHAPLFTWDGVVYASARVHHSPELAVQLETGSPVSFLRAHATRWLPKGAFAAGSAPAREGEIAHDFVRGVPLKVADREQRVPAIDLVPVREGSAHDDIATLGNDLLLQGEGIAVSFATMELAMVDRPPDPPATAVR